MSLFHLILPLLLLTGEEQRSPAQHGILLGEIPVIKAAPMGSTLAEGLVLEVNIEDGGTFGEISARSGATVKNGRIRVKKGYLEATDSPEARHKAASFVVDFDSPVFEPLVAEIKKQYGAKPSVDQMIAYVAAYIERKSFNRGFDIASEVVRTKEGDCTEHAVLLTALLRRFGKAARIVNGVAIVAYKGHKLAFAHAWTEVFENEKWRSADAAMYLDKPDTDAFELVTAIPIRIQKNETIGFAREVLFNKGVLNIKAVRL